MDPREGCRPEWPERVRRRRGLSVAGPIRRHQGSDPGRWRRSGSGRGADRDRERCAERLGRVVQARWEAVRAVATAARRPVVGVVAVGKAGFVAGRVVEAGVAGGRWGPGQKRLRRR